MQGLLHPFGWPRGAYSSLEEEKDSEACENSSFHQLAYDEDGHLANGYSEDSRFSDDLLPAFRDTPRPSKLPWMILGLVLIVDGLFLSWLILALIRKGA